jgi:RNA polymerase sigma-70 factor (ECF subfamily)
MASSEPAFEAIYAAHHARVLRWATRMAGRDLAADVAQAVWIRVYAHLDRFRGEAHVSTWLHVLVRNATTDAFRAQNRRALGHTRPIERALHMPCPRENPEEAACREERRRVIDSAMRRLTPAYQASLMAVLDGYSVEEAGALLGINPNTVKSRTHRARTAIAAELRARLQGETPTSTSRRRGRPSADERPQPHA